MCVCVWSKKKRIPQTRADQTIHNVSATRCRWFSITRLMPKSFFYSFVVNVIVITSFLLLFFVCLHTLTNALHTTFTQLIWCIDISAYSNQNFKLTSIVCVRVCAFASGDYQKIRKKILHDLSDRALGETLFLYNKEINTSWSCIAYAIFHFIFIWPYFVFVDLSNKSTDV